ncbi:MAG: hypothetical protein H6641_17210 [Caldilineaceae bacterium]|nr:hypothetical protein [Caldilineaceae bacterium]
MTITLKLIKDAQGCLYFQELERRIWASPDDDLIPTHVGVTVLKNGGALLGAYADDGPPETGGMVGAAFWWLGSDARPIAMNELSPAHDGAALKVCSHIAGVLPEYQGRGIGLKLKLKQRELVLQQGLTDRITWTYDPLYRANGVLNIHRLGAYCNTYFTNVYGDMTDALNRGVPSDRCQVDWMLNSRHVVQCATARPQQIDWLEQPLHVLPTTATVHGFRQPIDQPIKLEGAPIAMPIPADIGAIRRTDGALSLAWRLYTRQVLQEAFASQYRMVDCVNLPNQGWHYILALS